MKKWCCKGLLIVMSAVLVGSNSIGVVDVLANVNENEIEPAVEHLKVAEELTETPSFKMKGDLKRAEETLYISNLHTEKELMVLKNLLTMKEVDVLLGKKIDKINMAKLELLEPVTVIDLTKEPVKNVYFPLFEEKKLHSLIYWDQKEEEFSLEKKEVIIFHLLRNR